MVELCMDDYRPTCPKDLQVIKPLKIEGPLKSVLGM